MGKNTDLVERAFEECGNAILFATNDEFVPFVSVMIQSIIDHSDKSNVYDICILESSVSSDYREALRRQALGSENISIRCIDVSGIVKDAKFFTENCERLSEESYYRLLIPSMFSKYECVLYLDGDMVVNTDVADMFKISFDGALVVSSRDLWGIPECYKEGNVLRAYREELLRGFSIDDYFISGMCMFNIPAMRDYTAEKMLEIAGSREWKQHDQDILNALFADRKKIIHAKWDYMSDRYRDIRFLPPSLQEEFYEAQDDPKIIHFGGNRKPWKVPYMENDLLFWRAAYRTEFFALIISKVKSLGYKAYVLREVSGEYLEQEYTDNDCLFSYRGVQVGKFSTTKAVFDFLRIKDGYVEMEGFLPRLALSPEDKLEMYVCSGSVYYRTLNVKRYRVEKRDRKEEKWRGEPFLFRIPLNDLTERTELRLVASVNGNAVPINGFRFGKHTAIGNEFPNCYQSESDSMLIREKGCIVVCQHMSEGELQAYADSFEDDLSYLENYEEVVALRHAAKEKPGRPIWLFSDRTNKGDDNGEAMFRYVVDRQDELGVDPYFVIRKDSEDYDRISKIGNVVDFGSDLHKLLHLKCEMNFSAQADMESFCPFMDEYPAFRDLLQTQKFVFLQHGVIKNDISRWFNRTNINPWLFVVSAQRELDSILQTESYNLDKDIVKLTGLARHDLLRNDSKRYVTIMPTWRIWLAERPPQNRGVWTVRDGFEESSYFEFYSSLLNNKRLLCAAEKLGYQICFMPHPNIQSALHSFTDDSRVKLFDVSTRYSDVFAWSDLVVTDYSSSVMDFAYMRKPVLYTHFDEDLMFSGKHIASRGYFDDVRDGFGEVTYELDELVDKIVEYMESGCEIKGVYRDRIDNFFAYSDDGNRQRILDAVLEKRDVPKMGECSEVCNPGFGIISFKKPRKKGRAFYGKKVSSALDALGMRNVCSKYGNRYLVKCRCRWVNVFDTPLSLRKPTELVPVKYVSESKFAPEFSDYESSDVSLRFINHLSALAFGHPAFKGTDISGAIDRKELNKNWRVVADRTDAHDYLPGDIIRFENGTLAMAVKCSKGAIVLARCEEKNGAPIVTIGGLRGLMPFSIVRLLPKVSWVLRREYR